MNDSDTRDTSSRPYWNPYAAGAGLGLTLLLSFLVLGTGLGASGGIARIAASSAHALAPAAVEQNGYLGPWFANGSPLAHYLVAMLAGTLAGGFLSAAFAGRASSITVERGPRASAGLRLGLALLGGVLVGFASRLSLGCTSGLALSGGALLQGGAWLFVATTFGAAFLVAPLVRREWQP
jgi:uncharacterized membrane protein YedE/YeeE